MRNDPNGQDWADWQKHGYASYEAWIESKAGASLPDDWPGHALTSMTREQWNEAKSDWPFPRVDAAGDEDQETPTDA